MSIAMEQFGSQERRSESRALDGSPSRAFPYRLQCRACGFEPENAVTAPARCPKCAGSAWERFALPRSLLTTAEQSTSNLPAPYA
jgi:rubrerythrin